MACSEGASREFLMIVLFGSMQRGRRVQCGYIGLDITLLSGQGEGICEFGI